MHDTSTSIYPPRGSEFTEMSEGLKHLHYIPFISAFKMTPNVIVSRCWLSLPGQQAPCPCNRWQVGSPPLNISLEIGTCLPDLKLSNRFFFSACTFSVIRAGFVLCSNLPDSPKVSPPKATFPLFQKQQSPMLEAGPPDSSLMRYVKNPSFASFGIRLPPRNSSLTSPIQDLNS
ncbi:hypothetical protein Hypma_011025 [Hypsizygus marmoreus]|uniref:Uncharacterized protein n=1 Tax=Hypsizygus marmoreus TaxID=39966 RepID=A0A369JQM0_HYPMA|nr:hypothetical protein Hypma_011025 [Hypsizygus marmoreus]